MNRRLSAFLCVLLALVLGFTSGCELLNLLVNDPKDRKIVAKPAEPSKDELRIAPYVFHADFKIDRKHPVFRDLAQLRNQVYRELRLPTSDQQVHVYLFRDKPTYESYLQKKYPWLPSRRAFFIRDEKRNVGGEPELKVITYWSDRIEQDLRHELTHGLLHSVLLDVPLWLDEGLAEYFELASNKNGLNDAHLKQIDATTPFQPKMADLEELRQVKDMTPDKYRESWAWVHFALRGNEQARKVLLRYLHELRSNRNPGSLAQRMTKALPDSEQRLIRHVRQHRYRAGLVSLPGIP